MPPTTLQLPSGPVPLTVRRLKGARRYTVRWRANRRDVLLTLPVRGALKEALAFAESRAPWLQAQAESAEAARNTLSDGAVLRVHGRSLTLRHIPVSRGVAREEAGTLQVPGDAAFFERRVKDWLKSEAARVIVPLTREKAALLGKRAGRITFRDTSSRWGSCGPDGALSFSWRLILAPPEVLDYVVCHEVAHLVHMNHSQRFWNVVQRLCPEYEKSYRWLQRHGQSLY